MVFRQFLPTIHATNTVDRTHGKIGMKRRLMQSQRNDVFNLIKYYELNPLDFVWNEENSERSNDGRYKDLIDRIAYTGTDFYFLFDFKSGIHYSAYSPGADTLHQEEYPGSWREQSRVVGKWLSNLRREVNQSDLWSQFSEYRAALEDKLSPEVGNEPFTFRQFQDISNGVEQIKQYLRKNVSDPDHIKLIDEKLDYLIEAAKRQGRTDWVHTAIGVIFSLAISISLSPAQAKDVWNILKNSISGIIKFLGA